MSTAAEGDPAAAVLDFESSEVFARATLWENGLCDLEMIDVESGEQISWEHLERVESNGVAPTLDEFIRKLSSARKERRT